MKSGAYMKWIKKGLIFEPKGQFPWIITHASIPFAENIEEDIFRIYFAGRNENNRAQVGYIEIDIKDPQKILYLTENPVLILGDLAAFDDSGVMPSWIVNYNNKKYMYYIGWNQGVTVPFYFFIGLAISEDGGKNFKRHSKVPIVERIDIDPYLTASPWIIIEGEIWRLWYVSGDRWELVDDKPKHYYHIKYAESKEGINWIRNGVVSIDFKSKYEYAIARPCVLKEDGIYKMWYSYRASEKAETYRIGYAESKEGIKWQRKDDEVGIDVSESGWDSEMICYAHVFNHKGKKYMLYNGNGYGKTGIGLAVME
jgi:predicted GH43/DUF377 family glycosyl hydrolase